MAPPALRPLSVGEILDVSFTLYRRHFAPLAGVALVCSGIPVVLNMFIEASGGILENLSLVLVYYVVFAALNSIATAATVFIVSESYLGRPIDAWAALRRATPVHRAVLICSMLTALVVFVGFLLFVIPGIILIAGLFLAVPGARHRAGTERERRAVALVGADPRLALAHVRTAAGSRDSALHPHRRHRRAGGASSCPAQARCSTTPDASVSVAAVAISGLVQIFIYPLFYCVLTVAYYDLRVRKEGFDLEVLASTLLTA